MVIISGGLPDLQGGISDYTSILARHLAGQKAEVSIITSKSPLVKPIKGVKVLPVIKRWDFSCHKEVNQIIEKIKPDVIHLEFPGLPAPFDRHPGFNLLPFYLKMKGGKKIVFTTHEFGLYTWLGKLRQLAAMIFSDRVVVVTQDDRKRLASLFGEKVGQINIASSIFPAKRKEKEIKRIRGQVSPDREPIACFFGRLAEQKGLETLIEGLAQANQTTKVKLMVIGEFDSLKTKRKLKTQAKNLGLKERIYWAGYINGPRLSQHLYSADFAVFPFEDGLTLRRSSYLTALAHGLPVISTKTWLTPSLLKDRKNILLVPPNNPKELGQGMLELTQKKDLRTRLGRESEKLRPLFDWNAIAREHLKIYQSILK